MQNIFWTATTHLDRHQAIHEVQRVIAPLGFVVDTHLFSDLSLSITIELPECHIHALLEGLASMLQLDAGEALLSNATRERTIYLNISFARGSGDLRTEVPEVPG